MSGGGESGLVEASKYTSLSSAGGCALTQFRRCAANASAFSRDFSLTTKSVVPASITSKSCCKPWRIVLSGTVVTPPRLGTGIHTSNTHRRVPSPSRNINAKNHLPFEPIAERALVRSCALFPWTIRAKRFKSASLNQVSSFMLVSQRDERGLCKRWLLWSYTAHSIGNKDQYFIALSSFGISKENSIDVNIMSLC
jgi:hypothetical protein